MVIYGSSDHTGSKLCFISQNIVPTDFKRYILGIRDGAERVVLTELYKIHEPEFFY